MTISEAFRQDAWTRQDPRRPNDCATLTPQRHRDSTPRDDYARRQALVEFDALAAKVPGLALDEPQTICRLQFPVMRQHEAETHCDVTGRGLRLEEQGPEAAQRSGGGRPGAALTRVPANRPKHGAQATRNGVDTIGALVS